MGGAVVIVIALVAGPLTSGGVADIEPGTYKEPAPVDNTILRVIQAAPTGTITGDEPRKEVTVVFNHPLVPLAQLEQNTAGVLEISPATRGNFRWYGSRICAFIPESSWEFGRTYTIKVRKGTVSLNGKVLPEDYIFSFTFEIPDMDISAHPIPYQPSTIDYNQSFSLNFSHPVNLDQVRASIRLTCKNRAVPFVVAYREPSTGGEYDGGEYGYYDGPPSQDGEPNRRVVILTPSARFDRDAPVQLTVAEGLRAAGGVAQLKKEASFNHTTHGPLTVTFKNEGGNFYQDFWRNQLEFNNTVDLATARAAIRVTPAVPWRESAYGRTRYIALTSWAVKPGATYKFTIGNMSDVHGNALVSGDREFKITVPEFRPEFSLESDKTLLESAMSQKVPVEMANMPVITVGTAPFTLKHIQKSLADNDYSILDSLRYSTAEWKTGVGKYASGRVGYDLRKHLTPDRKGWVGVIFTGTVIDYEGKSKEETSGQLIQATDLGLSVKEAYDSSHIWVHSLNRGTPVRNAEITFYNIDDTIGTMRTNEQGYCRIPKDATGLVEKSLYVAAAGQNDRAFVTAREHDLPMYYVCNQFNDKAWERLLGGEIIFDRKLYRPGDTVNIKGILAVREKGRLTPLRGSGVTVTVANAKGEELFSKKITTSNQGGLWTSVEIPSDAPLGHYQVRMGESDESYINDTFQVEEFRPVSFSVNVAGLRDASVGENLPVTIEGRYLFGAPMQSAPVSYSCMRVKRRASFPNYSEFTFGDGQIWEDTDVDWSNAGYYTGDSGRLDSAGRYTFTLTPRAMLNQEKLQSPEQTLQLSDIYDLKMEAKVKDVDDKTVTRTAYSTVYPGAFLIGIRTKNRYQHFENDFTFDLVALANDGKATEGRAAVVTVIRYNYTSIMSKGPGGTMQPRNMLVKEQVLRQEITLSGTPRPFTFRPKDAGGYAIIVSESGGMSYSRENFYAWGGEMVSWYMDDDDAITLVPDKKEYEPGETARVLIQSPYERCKAIVTLERESVIWQKTIDITGSGTPVDIPIKDEYLPNVYFSVMLVRPRVDLPENADPKIRAEYIKNDLGMPRFKAGVTKISVSNASRKARLEVTPDKNEYSPGDPVTITIQTQPGAEVALAVADRAVLDLVDYQYANPVNKLYQNWPLGVRILENRRFLIKQYRYTQKGESPGGQGKGDELEGLGGFDKDSEDGSRKDIRYTAYWNPAIIADREGKATVTFTLPHNLSTFRIMALASVNGRYRNASREFRVRKALVIQKNLPRFIRPGDTLSLGAVVINQTDRSDNFIFSVQSPLLQGAVMTTTVTIGAGEAKEITFPVSLNIPGYLAQKKAPRKDAADPESKGPAGQVTVSGWLSVRPANIDKFTGAGFKKSDVMDRLAFTFPVREQPPEEAFTVAGFTTAEEKEFIRFPVPGLVVPGMGGLDITLAPTALVGLNKAFTFFKTNPFFCLEQRASAFLLTMSAGELLKQFSFRPPSDRDYDFSRIEELFLGEIGQFVNADGGFRAWKEDRYDRSDPYLTAYVAFVLQMARQNGYNVKSSVLDGAADYLENYVREPRQDGYLYILETFSLINYVLAAKGDFNSSLTDLLLDNEQKLSLRGKAYLALAIATKKDISDYRENKHTKRIVENLRNHMNITTRKVSFKEEGTDGFNRAFYSGGSTAGVILRLMMMVDRNNPLIASMVQYIIADRGGTVWGDSHSAGQAALALREYYRIYEAGTGSSSFKGTVSLNGKTVFGPTLDRGKLDVYSFGLPIDGLNAYGPAGVNHPMVFSSAKSNRLYYTATLSYFPALAKVEPRDEGMEIQRDIIDLGRPSKTDRAGTVTRGSLTRGTIYLVRIRVVAPKPCFNALITDPLPSNVEIVNTAFKTEESSLSKHTSKEKPSHEYWWMDSLPSIEYRDDRVVIVQNYLAPGMHEFTYLVRPLLRGTAQAPAAQTKLMYEPEVFGRTGSGSLAVK
ncbi:MAG TPA: MG2 domain-containing protein [Spirochaetota bacterium]|nr:MG2 domain-containing protein [Spirochaetota bacterium]